MADEGWGEGSWSVDLPNVDIGGNAGGGGGGFPIDSAQFSFGRNTGGEGSGLALTAEAAKPSIGGDATPGGGSWWSRFFGSAPQKGGQEGSGILGGLSVAGDVAKAALPFASIGGGIMGAINQRDLMAQIAKNQPIIQQTERAQLQNAQQGQALAAPAAAVAPDIKALAPKFADLSALLRSNVTTPEMDYGNKLLAMADSGKLLDVDKAALDDWERKQVADSEDFLARSGQGDSTERLDMLGKIKAQRATLESQALAGYRTQALQFLQAGSGNVASEAGLTGEEVATLGASTAPYAVAGGILSGSTGAAGAAGAGAAADNRTLEELIAAAQQQLGFSSGKAA